MSVTHWHHQEEWPGEARSVRDVRDSVATNLVRHGLSVMVDDAVLVVSESRRTSSCTREHPFVCRCHGRGSTCSLR